MSQTQNTTRNSALRFFSEKVKPGGEPRIINVTGTNVKIAEVRGADGKPFQMGFNDDPLFDMQVGLGFKMEPGDSFSKLVLVNPHDEQIEVDLYAGTLNLEDSRLNIVRGRSAPVSLAETVITGGQVELDPDAYIEITNDMEVGDSDDFQKRSLTHQLARVVVTNLDPAVDITLCNHTSGGAFGSVFPRQARLVDSSEGCRIVNETAAPVLVQVEIVWWKFAY